MGLLYLVCMAIVASVLFLAAEQALRSRAFWPPFDVTDGMWYRTLRSVGNSSETTDVVFYGSSRTQLAISPAAFTEQMAQHGHNVHAWNLALSASTDAGLIAHIEESLKADVVVVEQVGLSLSTPVRADDRERYRAAAFLGWTFHLEERIRKLLGKYCLICRDNLLASLLNRRYHKAEAHEDGWLEVSYNQDPEEIEAQKRHWATYGAPQQISLDDARASQRVYMTYFQQMLSAGTRLVVIRLPVGAKRRQQEDQLLAASYHTDFLSENQDILYIDANAHPLLAQYQPAEDSHLDAADAVQFTRAFADILNEWLAR